MVVVVVCAGADVVVVVCAGAEVVVVVCAGACVVVVVRDGPRVTKRVGGLVEVFFLKELLRLRCERPTDESACLWVRAVVRGADVVDES